MTFYKLFFWVFSFVLSFFLNVYTISRWWEQDEIFKIVVLGVFSISVYFTFFAWNFLMEPTEND